MTESRLVVGEVEGENLRFHWGTLLGILGPNRSRPFPLRPRRGTRRLTTDIRVEGPGNPDLRWTGGTQSLNKNQEVGLTKTVLESLTVLGFFGYRLGVTLEPCTSSPFAGRGQCS